jgi:hypothetical protein
MESSSIKRENFDWKTYLKKYKDIKNVDNEESAWKHWTNKGKKQGRKFYTLTSDENNNFYILTKEYKKRKNNDKKNHNVSCLTEDVVITDYVNDLKKKIHKIRKNQILIKEGENKVLLTEVQTDDNNVKLNEKQVKPNKKQIKLNKNKDKEEWSNKSENSEIFFFKTNKDEKWDKSSEKSEIFFNELQSDSFSSDVDITLNNKNIKIIGEEK